jgi:predicted DNA-binding antitoxin AbrB/MazE fold protein
MHGLEMEAVYEHGSLKLPRELPLQEGQKVTITIHAIPGAASRLSGLVHWKGPLEDLEYLAESDDNHSWAAEE